MNRLTYFLLTICMFFPLEVKASDTGSQIDETTEARNNWGDKLIKSPFGLGLDVQTKYIWRGMEMMTEDAAPVLFPSVNYSWKEIGRAHV